MGVDVFVTIRDGSVAAMAGGRSGSSPIDPEITKNEPHKAAAAGFELALSFLIEPVEYVIVHLEDERENTEDTPPKPCGHCGERDATAGRHGVGRGQCAPL